MLLSFALTVLLGSWATIAFAQPSNDDCANAINLVSGTTCTNTAGTTVMATQSLPAQCGANADDDVWYKFTAVSAEETITLSNVVGFTGAVIDARSGACNGTSIGCATGAFPLSLALTQLAVGTEYHFRLHSGGLNTGTFDVCVTHIAPPANDNCGNATNLTPTAGLFTDPGAQTNAGATASLGGSSCSGSASISMVVQDVWYAFTTDGDGGSAVISVDPSNATGDPVIHFFTSCAFGPLCYDLSGPGATETTPAISGLAANTTYYFRVYGQNTATFPFTVSVTGSALMPPVNNDCSGALDFPISPASGCSFTAVSTAAATLSVPSPTCTADGNNDDIWYTITPTVTGIHLINYNSLTAITGAAPSVVYELYTGACGALTAVPGSCGPIGAAGGVSDNESAVSLTAGVTYYLRLWVGGLSNSGSFNLCIQIPPPAPMEDECATATLLVSNTVCMNTAGTTVSATSSGVGASVCNPNDDDDVWFKFVAVSTSHTVTVSSPVGFTGVVIDARSGACPGTSFNCTVSGGGATLILNGLTITDTYLLRVHSGGVNVGTFNICVTHIVLPLELKSFTGQVKGSMNMLSWETLTEKNVQSHIVERSLDGSGWSEVGRRAGFGNSTVSVKYSLEDRAPLAKAYYRLRSVDFDGQENYSNTIVLTRKGEQFGITGVSPSPTKDNVTVQFNATQEEKVTIRVMDMTGHLVLEQTMEAVPNMNELTLSLQALQAGMYTVTVNNDTGASAPVRLVKQ